MLIFILLSLIVVILSAILGAIWKLILIVNKNLMSQNTILSKLEKIEGDVAKRGRVTDPFEVANKTNTIGASSNHIIIRKTPDQIRNENFEKIKQGANYGIDS